MTVKDLASFYADKKEHYDISDSFVKCNDGKYQQSRKSGYMAYARKMGIIMDYSKAEPNQKWHLLEAYCAQKGNDFKISRGTFRCPELVLWMAEAAGIDKKIIIKAEEGARQIIDEGVNGRARNAAARYIKELIVWDVLEEKIMKEISHV
ncbi:MAG: hypothetical protein PUF12_06575 [Thermoflexaceae bacterium]|nr:hypothetical protein [Thermoflexaceae bacterium]